MRNIFHKHPVSQSVEAGTKVTLSADALCKFGAKFVWETNTGSGWTKLKNGEGKTFTFDMSEAYVGDYRCICAGQTSKYATVTLEGKEKSLKGTKEESFVATKENDAFIEILEGTGEDAPQELVEKVVKATAKKLPEELKLKSKSKTTKVKK